METTGTRVSATSEIELSEVNLSEIHGTRYYLNSEGFKALTPMHLAALTMFAETQAGDGMPVRETRTVVENTIQELPSTAELMARARELTDRVTAARRRDPPDTFTRSRTSCILSPRPRGSAVSCRSCC